MRAASRFLGPALAALLLAGCSQAELYTGLSEREANDMVTVLRSAGLEADKSTHDGKAWTLMATKSDFVPAVALLEARGLPREKYESLGDVFKKDGFISSPVEEHARLIYGLSQELSNTLSTMDGVVVARVHIAIPDADPMSDDQKPSSASVFIKYDPQVDLSSQVGSIKSLVVNSVEGLPYERVSVILTPARPLSTVAGSSAAASPPVALFWVAAATASALAGGAMWWLDALRRRRLA